MSTLSVDEPHEALSVDEPTGAKNDPFHLPRLDE